MMRVALIAVLLVGACDVGPKRKRSEAVVALERIAAAATEHATKHGKFPLGTGTPAPSKGCCGQDRNKCQVEPAAWQTAPWLELGFSQTSAHLFQYTYESQGTTFYATAIGDLDCDGTPAHFELRGAIENGKPQTTQIVPPAPGKY
jgi:hypothetical protein